MIDPLSKSPWRKPGPKRDEELFLLTSWLFAGGASIKEIAKDLGLSERTVGKWLREIRDSLANAPTPQRPPLRGKVVIESYTYKPAGTRTYAKRPILLAMMGGSGEVRLFLVTSRTQSQIYPLVRGNIQRGSTLLTNTSNLYVGLRKEGFPVVEQHPARLWGKPPYSTGTPLSPFWEALYAEMGRARGVRSGTFIQRAREVEMRWNFRGKPTIELYKAIRQTLGVRSS